MTKQCSVCKKEKFLEDFHKNINGRLGRQANCKKCASEKGKKWYKNPINRQNAIDNYKAFHKENRARNLAMQAKWRAKKANKLPSWFTEDTFNKTLRIYEEATRLSKETGIPHEVDHRIPLNHSLISGLHVPENLIIITELENHIKFDKWDGTYDNDSWREDVKNAINFIKDKYT